MLETKGEGTVEKIQLLIVSHQSLFREGIQHSLAHVKDIEITGAPEINDEVLNSIDSLAPDVALVDIDGPSENGLTLGRRIKQRSPNIGVIMLTSNANDAQLFQALKAQAVAYLSKDVTGEKLTDTIRAVARGEHPINEALTTRPKLAEQVLNQFQELYWRSEAESLISPLTPRRPRF